MTSENYVDDTSFGNIPGLSSVGTIHVHSENATFGSVFKGTGAWYVEPPFTNSSAGLCGSIGYAYTYAFKMFIPAITTTLVIAQQLSGTNTNGQVWFVVNPDGSYQVWANDVFAANPQLGYSSPSGAIKLGAWSDVLIQGISDIAYVIVDPGPPVVCFSHVFTGSVGGSMQIGAGPLVSAHANTIDSGNAAGSTYGPLAIGDVAGTTSGALKVGKIYGQPTNAASVPFPSFVGGYLPNGAGSSTQWTPVGEATNWEAVSQIPGSSSAYVHDATVHDLDMYAVSCNSVSFNTVSAVHVLADMYEDVSDNHNVAIVVGNGTNEYRYLASTGSQYPPPPPFPVTAANAGWTVSSTPQYYNDMAGTLLS